jgi:hypothetical protein
MRGGRMIKGQIKLFVATVGILTLAACSGSREPERSATPQQSAAQAARAQPANPNLLTRPLALDLISKAEKTGMGSSNIELDGTPRAYARFDTAPCPENNPNGRFEPDLFYTVLQAQGLVAITAAKCQPTVIVIDGWAAAPTAKGRSLALSVRGDRVFVTALGKDVTAVTGIAKQGGGYATVDFTWKWRLTPLGEAFGNAGLSLFGTDLRYGYSGRSIANHQGTGEADLQLYDDGWRVGQLEFR